MTSGCEELRAFWLPILGAFRATVTSTTTWSPDTKRRRVEQGGTLSCAFSKLCMGPDSLVKKMQNNV